MSCPVTPEEFEALIPGENDDICEKMTKMIEFQRLFVTWYSCWFDEEGNLKQEIIDELCASDCVSGSSSSSTTTSAPVENQDFDYTDGDEFDYIVPEGVTSIHYRIWGAGGGGGGGANYPLSPVGTPLGGGGGRGGGGYIEADLAVTPLETLKLRIGGAGTAGSTPGGTGGDGNAGTSGQSSYIKRGSTVLAEAFGGSSGNGGSGTGPGSGGTGGSSSYEAGSTDVAQTLGGNGIAGTFAQYSAPGGAGGNGGSGGSGGAAGAAGGIPGGAGGGGNAFSTAGGGAGANGRISIG